MAAQGVVDVGLHGGVGAQLDHLPGHPRKKPHATITVNSRVAPAGLDDGSTQQGDIGACIAAPPSHRCGCDEVGEERPAAGRGDEYHCRSGPAKPVPPPVCRTITSTSNVLMPNTPRWAARPASAAPTDGVFSTARAP